MELTKEQIQYIEHRLENEGIKYWDIRIEMLDHVVSVVEKKLKPENSEYEFKEMILASFIELGWKKNFNGGGFDTVLALKLKLHNKKQNRNFRQYCKETFLSCNFILGVMALAVVVYCFQEHKLALKTLFFIILGSYIACLFRFALKYKVMNSARLRPIILFMTFPLSIFNGIIFLPKVFFDYEVGISVLSYTMIIVSSFSAIGISYLNQEFKKAQKIYNQLIY
jgi:hypothetical protein